MWQPLIVSEKMASFYCTHYIFPLFLSNLGELHTHTHTHTHTKLANARAQTRYSLLSITKTAYKVVISEFITMVKNSPFTPYSLCLFTILGVYTKNTITFSPIKHTLGCDEFLALIVLFSRSEYSILLFCYTIAILLPA